VPGARGYRAKTIDRDHRNHLALLRVVPVEHKAVCLALKRIESGVLTYMDEMTELIGIGILCHRAPDQVELLIAPIHQRGHDCYSTVIWIVVPPLLSAAPGTGPCLRAASRARISNFGSCRFQNSDGISASLIGIAFGGTDLSVRVAGGSSNLLISA